MKVTHMEARCYSGSLVCSPKSELAFLTELFQRASCPIRRKEKMCLMLDVWTTLLYFIPIFINNMSSTVYPKS